MLYNCIEPSMFNCTETGDIKMTKSSSMRDYENDGFVGIVYLDDGLKIVDRTATYNKRIDAFKAAKSLSDHYNSGGDMD